MGLLPQQVIETERMSVLPSLRVVSITSRERHVRERAELAPILPDGSLEVSELDDVDRPPLGRSRSPRCGQLFEVWNFLTDILGV
jgi:hypothetical protein